MTSQGLAGHAGGTVAVRGRGQDRDINKEHQPLRLLDKAETEARTSEALGLDLPPNSSEMPNECTGKPAGAINTSSQKRSSLSGTQVCPAVSDHLPGSGRGVTAEL